MQQMTKDEIVEYVRPFLVEAGLEPISIKVEADEPPMDFYPIVDVVVSKNLMSKDRGTGIRSGYDERDAEDQAASAFFSLGRRP